MSKAHPEELAKADAVAARVREELEAGRSPLEDDEKGYLYMALFAHLRTGQIIKHFDIREKVSSCVLRRAVVADYEHGMTALEDDPQYAECYQKMMEFTARIGSEFLDTSGEA